MNRAIFAILIPLLMVTQSLLSVPHSHAGSSTSEPAGHAARPHFHFHGSHRHHDPHEGEESSDLPAHTPLDHDSVAVYTGDVLHPNVSRVTIPDNAEFMIACTCDDESVSDTVSRFSTQLRLPPLQRSKCALYLQLRTLRC